MITDEIIGANQPPTWIIYEAFDERGSVHVKRKSESKYVQPRRFYNAPNIRGSGAYLLGISLRRVLKLDNHHGFRRVIDPIAEKEVID